MANPLGNLTTQQYQNLMAGGDLGLGPNYKWDTGTIQTGSPDAGWQTVQNNDPRLLQQNQGGGQTAYGYTLDPKTGMYVPSSEQGIGQQSWWQSTGIPLAVASAATAGLASLPSAAGAAGANVGAGVMGAGGSTAAVSPDIAAMTAGGAGTAGATEMAGAGAAGAGGAGMATGVDATAGGILPSGAGLGAAGTGAAASGGSLFGGAGSGFASLLNGPYGYLNLASSALGALGSYGAAQQQANAAQNATNAQVGMFNTVMGNLKPYQQAGAGALGQLTGYMNADQTGGPGGAPGLLHQFGPADLTANLAPNYGFQLAQGQGAVRNAAAASGGATGGNEFTGEQAFTQNFAGNAYQQAFNNYQQQQNNVYGRLGNIAQLGQSSATGSASGAPLFASGISQTLQGLGQAQASGTVGATNAITGGLGNLAGYYMMNQMLGQP